jgi:hypothetical protein
VETTPDNAHETCDGPVVTKAGTRIARWHNLVGKRIGDRIYVHRLYAPLVIPAEALRRAQEALGRLHPGHQYACVMYSLATGAVRFDEAPDFDSAREPRVGRHVTVFRGGATKAGTSDNIWHHKFCWVLDSYPGFDVEASRQWSRKWTARLPEPALGTKAAWEEQLWRAGL